MLREMAQHRVRAKQYSRRIGLAYTHRTGRYLRLHGRRPPWVARTYAVGAFPVKPSDCAAGRDHFLIGAHGAPYGWLQRLRARHPVPRFRGRTAREPAATNRWEAQ
jgi:hypothetical protein